jgi:hypothetical protein
MESLASQSTGSWLDIEYPLDLSRPRPEIGGLTLTELQALSFGELARFKLAGAFPPGYPSDTATFYSPRDPGLHAVDAWVAMQATHSWEVNMYGEDDPLVASITRMHCDNPDLLVVVNLDKSQYGGKHEQEIMTLFQHGQLGNSIAVGKSIKGAISHLKITVADKRVKTGGSTNQSQSGEQKQDNELVVTTNALLAAEASSVIGLNHLAMLAQMAAAVEGATKAAT